MSALGQFYTRTLRVGHGQTVIDRGPYRMVCHPGYLGSMALWTGARLAVNWTVAIVTLALLALAYSNRIRVEEELLNRELGEAYRAYSRSTYRLIPGVW